MPSYPRRILHSAVSDLPSSALDYAAVVSEYFLGLRGAGLMLSPLDEEIVAGWERRGIPVAVVCRGLRCGLEQLPASAGPRAAAPSLRALPLAVDDEWRAYQSGRVGDAPPPPARPPSPRRGSATRARSSRESGARRRPRCARATAPRGGRSAGRGAPATPLERLEAAVAAADARLLAAWVGTLSAPVPRGARAALPPARRRPAARHDAAGPIGRRSGCTSPTRAGGGGHPLRGSV